MQRNSRSPVAARGGPVVLRPVRATPCFKKRYSGVKHRHIQSDMMIGLTCTQRLRHVTGNRSPFERLLTCILYVSDIEFFLLSVTLKYNWHNFYVSILGLFVTVYLLSFFEFLWNLQWEIQFFSTAWTDNVISLIVLLMLIEYEMCS